MNSQNNNDFIAIENALAHGLLQEATSNPNIKSSLQTIATKIYTHILKPLQEAVLSLRVSSLADLPSSYQNCINELAKQNLDEEKPFGAVLDNFKKANEITSSMSNIKVMLAALAKHLTNVTEIKDNESIIHCLKAIASLSVCYFHYLPELHSQDFDTIKNMIWLTPEEEESRITRKECGEEPQLALTFGISAKLGVDLVPAYYGVGMNSGKALFAGAGIHNRLEMITKQFDKTVELRDQLKNQITALLAKETSPFNQMQINQYRDEMIQLENTTLLKYLKIMQQYKIPVVKSERKALSHYVKETTFLKLAKYEKDGKEICLPLVANISRSTARTLITLQDLGAFTNDKDLFDLDRAQICANCISLFYILGGHHSLLEVAEIYNRLLDYIALQKVEQLPPGVIPARPENLPYLQCSDLVEKKMPYYIIGDYISFLHPSYAEKLRPVIMQNKPNLKPTSPK